MTTLGVPSPADLARNDRFREAPSRAGPGRRVFDAPAADDPRPLWKREAGTAVLFDNASHKPGVRAEAEAADRMLAALGDAGWTTSTLSACRDGFAPCGQMLRDRRPDLILAFGGDGTIAGCAHIAAETGAILLPVPGGTMNLSAKDLGAFGEPETLAERAMLGSTRRVDIAYANGRAFLHSIAFGLVPSIGTQREAFRDRRTLPGRWTAALDAARVALFKRPASLRITTENGSTTVRTLSAVVSNNRLADHGGVHFGRSSVDGGRLGLYVSMHRAAAGRVKLAAALLTGRLERDPLIRRASADTIAIASQISTIAVSVDGEILSMRSPVRVVQRPGGLRVLSPVPAERASAQETGPQETGPQETGPQETGR